MNSLVYITIFAVFALAFAADMKVLPDAATGSDGVNTGVTVAIKDTTGNGATLNNVTFTVTSSDESVIISYGASQTRANVGSIQYGATGYGSFYFVGGAGEYTLTVHVSYRKGNNANFLNFTNDIDLQILIDGGSPPSGRREITVDLEDGAIQGRTADVAINPTGWNTEDGTPTWVGMSLTAGTAALSNVSFTVTPSDLSVIIVYPSSGNYIGSIAANHEKDTSFQITGGAGEYYLNITVKYRKTGSTYYYISQQDTLEILYNGGTTAGRFAALGAKLGFNPDNFNVQTVVAIAAGVAAFAGVAIVGVALFLRKSKNSSVLTTTSTALVA